MRNYFLSFNTLSLDYEPYLAYYSFVPSLRSETTTPFSPMLDFAMINDLTLTNSALSFVNNSLVADASFVKIETMLI